MKIAVSILAFILLYLSVQPPAFPVSYATEQDTSPMVESCAASKKSCSVKSRSSCPSEKDDIPNPCNQCVCNPLAPCCYYLPTEKTLPYIAGHWFETRQAVPADENILSSYISDVWKPPKFSLVAI